jgi:hypothetical protein
MSEKNPEFYGDQKNKRRRYKHFNHECYNLLRSIEGGPNRTHLLWMLKNAGIIAVPDVSCYVGHTAICVYGNKRIQRKASRIISGKAWA